MTSLETSTQHRIHYCMRYVVIVFASFNVALLILSFEFQLLTRRSHVRAVDSRQGLVWAFVPTVVMLFARRDQQFVHFNSSTLTKSAYQQWIQGSGEDYRYLIS